MHPGTQIKPLAGKRPKIIMPAVRISAADTGYTFPVIAAGEKMFADRPDPFEAELPECIGILLIIPAEEIGKMSLEDLMESVSSPRHVSTGLFMWYGPLRYSHIRN